jgi:hypothetical protein
MFILTDKSGAHVATVTSLNGIDMTGLTSRKANGVDAAVLTEAELLQRIERERREAAAGVLTPGKDLIYAAKQAEIRAFEELASEPSAEELATSFPFAAAEMALIPSGKLADVIATFKAGAQASTLALARIEALAQVRRSAVRAASTSQEKRDAFSSIKIT